MDIFQLKAEEIDGDQVNEEKEEYVGNGGRQAVGIAP